MLAAAVGVSLMASAGETSADPWKGESGHDKHWKHEGRGEGWGRGGPRFGDGYGRSHEYGYYEERRSYRGARFRDYGRPRFRAYDRYGY
jgi:hypothetical protein